MLCKQKSSDFRRRILVISLDVTDLWEDFFTYFLLFVCIFYIKIIFPQEPLFSVPEGKKKTL